ncbi:Hypothetical_protein [Hexamita inflata]|uniref:Hypothetical_protein n=1 Tax=Hexamita inflata TaxID=28002 RepID=A0AA86QX04_9EUKA|nr:Hypothetical protein HINF_LOCUS49972 [Hexamita inflata]
MLHLIFILSIPCSRQDGSTCICDNTLGLAVADNGIECVRCWDNQTVISVADNTKCVPCKHNYLLGNTVYTESNLWRCQVDYDKGYVGKVISASEYDSNYPPILCVEQQLIQSEDKLKCITCWEKFPQYPKYTIFNFNQYGCIGNVSSGYTGAINYPQFPVTNCTLTNEIPDIQVRYADFFMGSVCISCPQMLRVTTGVIIDINTLYTCVVDFKRGWAGKMQSSRRFDPAFPLVNCWDSQSVMSEDGFSCVSCTSRYSQLSNDNVVFNSSARYGCAPNKKQGYAGQISSLTGFSSQKPLQKCWDSSLVISQDGYECVTCSQFYQQVDSAVKYIGNGKCQVNYDNGFAGEINDDGAVVKPIVNCQIPRLLSSDKSACISCNQLYQVANGLIFDASAQYKCKSDNSNGWAGSVLDSSINQSNALRNCWAITQVVSQNQCISCSSMYKQSPDSLIFDQSAPTHCSVNKALGYAGKIASEQSFDVDYPLINCGSQKQVSSDGFSCVNQKSQTQTILLSVLIPVFAVGIIVGSVFIVKKVNFKKVQSTEVQNSSSVFTQSKEDVRGSEYIQQQTLEVAKE